MAKISRGTADNPKNIYNLEKFKEADHNEVFDDGILKYLATRQKVWLENIKDKRQRIFNAMLRIVAPTFGKNVSKTIFEGKMENFLACRRIAAYLRENAFEDVPGNFFEEVSLVAINKTLTTAVTGADLRLLFYEIPKILPLKYSVVEDIRQSCLKVFPKFMDTLRNPTVVTWREFTQFQYLLEMLNAFEPLK